MKIRAPKKKAAWTYEREIERLIEKLPLDLLADKIREKLATKGRSLPLARRRAIAKGILRDGVRQVEITLAPGETGHDGIELADEDFRDILDRLDKFSSEQLPKLTEDLISATSPAVLSTLNRRWPRELKKDHKAMEGFRDRLYLRWGRGLDGLRMLAKIAREVGQTNSRNRLILDGTNVKLHDAFFKLHARACQVTEEIICLLSSGFADGAMARWRTLHEIATVSLVLSKGGEQLAERYLAHEIVETKKGADLYQTYSERLGQDPFTPAELDAIEREYVLALDRYGTNFRSQNGWASEYVKKGNPNFADLEIAAGVDHLRPYYKLASHNVHANPKGVLFKLGFFGDANTLLAGPSNAGLADPGHSTAISLNQISATILHFFPSFDNIIAVKVMSLLADTIGKEFLKAHKQLEQDELDRRAQTVPSRRGKRGRHKDRRKKARSKQSG